MNRTNRLRRKASTREVHKSYIAAARYVLKGAPVRFNREILRYQVLWEGEWLTPEYKRRVPTGSGRGTQGP